MKTKIVIIALLLIILASCTTEHENVQEEKFIIDKSVHKVKENYLILEESNNNMISFNYTNLPDYLKGIKLYIERYNNGEKITSNLIGLSSGGSNVSISRNGEIYCYFELLSNNEFKIELSNYSSTAKASTYMDLDSYVNVYKKTIVNQDMIKISDKEFVLGMFIVNDENIKIADKITEIESYIDNVIKENKIVFVVKGSFIE